MPDMVFQYAPSFLAVMIRCLLANGPRSQANNIHFTEDLAHFPVHKKDWWDFAQFIHNPQRNPEAGFPKEPYIAIGPIENGPFEPRLQSRPRYSAAQPPPSSSGPVIIDRSTPKYTHVTNVEIDRADFLQGKKNPLLLHVANQGVSLFSPRRMVRTATPQESPHDPFLQFDSSAPYPDVFLFLQGRAKFSNPSDYQQNLHAFDTREEFESKGHYHLVEFGFWGLLFRISAVAARYQLEDQTSTSPGYWGRVGDWKKYPEAPVKNPQERYAIDIIFEPIIIETDEGSWHNPIADDQWDQENQWFLRWLIDYFAATAATYPIGKGVSRPDARGLRYSLFLDSIGLGKSFGLAPNSLQLLYPFNAGLSLVPRKGDDRALQIGLDIGPAADTKSWQNSWDNFFNPDSNVWDWPILSRRPVHHDAGLFIDGNFITRVVSASLPRGLSYRAEGWEITLISPSARWDQDGLHVRFLVLARLLTAGNEASIPAGELHIDTKFGVTEPGLIVARTEMDFSVGAAFAALFVVGSPFLHWLYFLLESGAYTSFAVFFFPPIIPLAASNATSVPSTSLSNPWQWSCSSSEKIQICNFWSIQGDPYFSSLAMIETRMTKRGLHFYGDYTQAPLNTSSYGDLEMLHFTGFEMLCTCEELSPDPFAEMILKNTGGIPLTLFEFKVLPEVNIPVTDRFEFRLIPLRGVRVSVPLELPLVMPPQSQVLLQIHGLFTKSPTIQRLPANVAILVISSARAMVVWPQKQPVLASAGDIDKCRAFQASPACRIG